MNKIASSYFCSVTCIRTDNGIPQYSNRSAVGEFSEEQIKALLKMEDMEDGDRALLDRVTETAKLHFQKFKKDGDNNT